MNKDRVLLLIPAYNEAENIERVVTEILEFRKNLDESSPTVDYVIINDGSADDTARICTENGYNFVNLAVNLGLAGAFATGMEYALRHGYDYAVQYDGDGQHDVHYLPDMYKMAKEQNLNICIGSRFVTQKKPGGMRMFGSNIISACIKLTTGVRVKDPTSGMRLYDREMIESFGKRMNMGPEPDTVAYLLRKGARIGECQVTMRERVAGESYLNVFSSAKYMFNICSSILIAQWFR